jgi:hypothetical protein
MNSGPIENEILSRVRRLDPARQQRVLDYVRSLEEQPATLSDWLESARAFRQRLQAQYGDDVQFGSQAVLDEIREDRLDDLR